MDETATKGLPLCPPELVGIAAQFEQMGPATRAAAAGVLYSALASIMILQPKPTLPPLTTEQQAVIDYLRENGVTSAEELAKAIGYSAKTIKRWCADELRAHGVVATSRGYGIPD